MLEFADMKEVLEQTEKATGNMSASEKADWIERELHACAEKRGLVLELLVTDDPWFE